MINILDDKELNRLFNLTGKPITIKFNNGTKVNAFLVSISSKFFYTHRLDSVIKNGIRSHKLKLIQNCYSDKFSIEELKL